MGGGVNQRNIWPIVRIVEFTNREYVCTWWDGPSMPILIHRVGGCNGILPSPPSHFWRGPLRLLQWVWCQVRQVREPGMGPTWHARLAGPHMCYQASGWGCVTP